MTDRSTTYSSAEARRFHERTTLRNWSDTPNLMHYAFLHMAEFFPHAVIHRSGPIMEVGQFPRADIAGFEAESSQGPEC